jgi:hypothetical protein
MGALPLRGHEQLQPQRESSARRVRALAHGVRWLPRAVLPRRSAAAACAAATTVTARRFHALSSTAAARPSCMLMRGKGAARRDCAPQRHAHRAPSLCPASTLQLQRRL